jgi:hypothetical protein
MRFPIISTVSFFLTAFAYSSPTNEEIYAATPTNLIEEITLDGLLYHAEKVADWKILSFENKGGLRSIIWRTTVSIRSFSGPRYHHPFTDSGILTALPSRIAGPNFDAATKPIDLDGGVWEFRYDAGEAFWAWQEVPVNDVPSASGSVGAIYLSLKLNRQIDQSVRRKKDRRAKALLKKQRVILARGGDVTP